METIITDSGKAITLKEIQSFESQHNILIPDSYKDFLLQHNGGYPIPNCFEVKKYGNSVLSNFMGINTKDEINSLEYCLEIFKNRVPDEFLVIGRDPIGNLILIGTKGKYKDKIYFWWHDEESDTNKSTYSNIYIISKNLTEFIGNLTKEKEESYGELQDLFDEGNIEKIKKLIDSGWNVNTPLEMGDTAIQRMAIANNLKILELLIEKNATLNGTIIKALNNNNLEAIKILLAAGADPNEINNGNSLLHKGIVSENIPFIKLLLTFNPNVNEKNDVDKTPLGIAKIKLKRGNSEMQEIIDLLISKGAIE